MDNEELKYLQSLVTSGDSITRITMKFRVKYPQRNKTTVRNKITVLRRIKTIETFMICNLCGQSFLSRGDLKCNDCQIDSLVE